MSSIKFDNIFDVVTNAPEESNELQTRADLMIVIRDILDDMGWKQVEAAKKLKVTQHRVSDLLNGKINKFSIGLLMTYLFRLGYRFKPVYKNRKLSMTAKAAKGQRKVRVEGMYNRNSVKR